MNKKIKKDAIRIRKENVKSRFSQELDQIEIQKNIQKEKAKTRQLITSCVFFLFSCFIPPLILISVPLLLFTFFNFMYGHHFT